MKLNLSRAFDIALTPAVLVFGAAMEWRVKRRAASFNVAELPIFEEYDDLCSKFAYAAQYYAEGVVSLEEVQEYFEGVRNETPEDREQGYLKFTARIKTPNEYLNVEEKQKMNEVLSMGMLNVLLNKGISEKMNEKLTIISHIGHINQREVYLESAIRRSGGIENMAAIIPAELMTDRSQAFAAKHKFKTISRIIEAAKSSSAQLEQPAMTCPQLR